MKALTTLWELKYKNSETSSNLITDHAGNLIFTYNRYAGDVLRERMNGTLVSISQWGEENWSFIFPENNYMYFKDRIAIYGDNIYAAADSSREYDSGFERGLYAFDVNGGYKWHYAATLADEITLDSKGVIYICDNQDYVYSFDPSGKLLEKGGKMLLVEDSVIVMKDKESPREKELRAAWENESDGQIISVLIQGGRAYCLAASSEERASMGSRQVSLTCFDIETMHKTEE